MPSKKFDYFSLIVFLSVFRSHYGVLMDPAEEEFPEDIVSYGFNEAFQHCVRRDAGNSIFGVFPCFSKGALAGLVTANEKERVEFLDGVILERDLNDKEPRSIIPEDVDYSDYRSVLEATSGFIGRRSLKWDMSVIHPGLFMKIGPTFGGAGVLEFIMDRGYPRYTDRTVGTGRMMLRQFLLPLLLGFKIKLVTLLPLLIGLLIFMSKKALILSKIAVFVTTILGVNSFFLMQQQQQTQLQNPFGNTFLNVDPQPIPFHNNIGSLDKNSPYRGHFEEFRDSSSYRDRDRDRTTGVDERGGRNFAWEDEKPTPGVLK